MLIAPLLAIAIGFGVNVSPKVPAESRSHLAQASEPLRKLSFLNGKWESHETSKGSDGKEVSFTLQGKNEWILEGKYLQIDESFEIPGQGKFANHILITYDDMAKLYRAWWFNTRSPEPISFSGQWVEKDLVLTQEKERFRIIYHPLSAGHYKAELEIKAEGKWEAFTRAEYKQRN